MQLLEEQSSMHTQYCGETARQVGGRSQLTATPPNSDMCSQKARPAWKKGDRSKSPFSSLQRGVEPLRKRACRQERTPSH